MIRLLRRLLGLKEPAPRAWAVALFFRETNTTRYFSWSKVVSVDRPARSLRDEALGLPAPQGPFRSEVDCEEFILSRSHYNQKSVDA
jgi:hypothetical protein